MLHSFVSDSRGSSACRSQVSRAILTGTGGQGSFSFIFSDTNLANSAETFFSIRDKAMRGIGLLALSAFFMPRCSAIHTWDAVVFFHSNLLRIAPFAAQ